MIDDFRGRWRVLSNFAPTPLIWEGRIYPTAEHAFQAGKTMNHDKRAHVAMAATPGAAKRLGRFIELRYGWDQIRVSVMRSVLDAKFTPYPDRCEELLATQNALLVEGNRWHDQFWGDCRCGRSACATPGQNHLGLLLRRLRHQLGGQL